MVLSGSSKVSVIRIAVAVLSCPPSRQKVRVECVQTQCTWEALSGGSKERIDDDDYYYWD